MQLSISERFALLDLLPDKSNYATWGVIDKVVQSLVLTEIELKEAKTKPLPNDPSRLNIENNFEKDIELSDWFLNHCEAKLRDMDRNYILLQQHRSLFEKFVINRK